MIAISVKELIDALVEALVVCIVAILTLTDSDKHIAIRVNFYSARNNKGLPAKLLRISTCRNADTRE